MKYLLLDFGSTYTKLTAVDISKAKVIGHTDAITTINTDIKDGYHECFKKLEAKVGKQKYDKIIACSSAAGGLKMAAIGLVESLTVEAARRVCLGAGAKVDLVVSGRINKSQMEVITSGKIDIVLLAGGTDGGDRDTVLENAKRLAQAKVKVPIIYAGNKECQDDISEILSEAKIKPYTCENVMPLLNQLNIKNTQEVIREIFMGNIIKAKGIGKIEEEIDEVIFPTPKAVLEAATLLADGYLDEEGLGDIILVDVGGATTDIYSIGSGSPSKVSVLQRGLEEPYAKRTVEGDLGMRYSALGILEALSLEERKKYLKDGIDIEKEAKKRHDNIEFLPVTDYDFKVEKEMAKVALDNAISRHVGFLESVYTPFGVMEYQTGKDLTKVKFVIGTGGVLINSKDTKDILSSITYTLKKPNQLRPLKVEFMVDKSYILSAMGLLSIDYPEVALKVLKEEIVKL